MTAKILLRTTLAVAVMLLSGCKGTTPENLGKGAAGFAGEVLYNSAGSENQANRENSYPHPCQQCEGLGYHSVNGDSSQRADCHACMGRGWN
jgi:hypothetical protein